MLYTLLILVIPYGSFNDYRDEYQPVASEAAVQQLQFSSNLDCLDAADVVVNKNSTGGYPGVELKIFCVDLGGKFKLGIDSDGKFKLNPNTDKTKSVVEK